MIRTSTSVTLTRTGRRWGVSIALGLFLIAGPALGADTTPPDIAYTLNPVPNADGWNNSSVTLSWTVTDPQSPNNIRRSGCGSVTRTTDTSGTTYTCSARSPGGSSNKSVTIKRDTVLPTATITTPSNGATFTAGTTVTPAYNCNDARSGIATCTATPIDTATAGTNKAFKVTATDRASLQL